MTTETLSTERPFLSARELRQQLLFGDEPSIATIQELMREGAVAQNCEDFCDQISVWLEKQGIAHKVAQSPNPERWNEFEQTIIILTGENLVLDPTAYQYVPTDEALCFIGPRERLHDLSRRIGSSEDPDIVWPPFDRCTVIKDLSDLPTQVITTHQALGDLALKSELGQLR